MPIRKRFTTETEKVVQEQQDGQLVDALRVIYMTLKTYPKGQQRMDKEWASFAALAQARGHDPGQYFARNIHEVILYHERYRKTY